MKKTDTFPPPQDPLILVEHYCIFEFPFIHIYKHLVKALSSPLFRTQVVSGFI